MTESSPWSERPNDILERTPQFDFSIRIDEAPDSVKVNPPSASLGGRSPYLIVPSHAIPSALSICHPVRYYDLLPENTSMRKSMTVSSPTCRRHKAMGGFSGLEDYHFPESQLARQRSRSSRRSVTSSYSYGVQQPIQAIGIRRIRAISE